MMRALIVGMLAGVALAMAIGLLVGGCGGGRGGVVITLQAPGLAVDELHIAVTLDGDPLSHTATRTLTLQPVDGKRLEADFEVLVPTGCTVDVTALANGVVQGHGEATGVVLEPKRLVEARVRLSGSDADGGGGGSAGGGGGGGTMATPDMAMPIAVTHVDGGVAPGSAQLIVSQSIDTTNFKLDGNDPPAGATFADAGGLALLSVGTFTVVNHVAVSGQRALVVVAADRISIEGVLDAGGKSTADGPGAAKSGTGGDGNYLGGNGSSSGGGGAGFGTVGGAGGGNTNSGAPGMGGSAFGDPALTILQGGGRGGSAGCFQSGGAVRIVAGGGGGGAVQLTAVNSIGVAAMGQIVAGGGGGVSYLDSGCPQNGGGGGGAGGALFLEAPTVSIAGTVFAPGGGGGAGNKTSTEPNGSDGTACPSKGGLADGAGASGGDGVCAGTGGTGTSPSDLYIGGGGGGGGAGRIVLRTHNAPTFNPSSVLPAPTLLTF